MSPAALPSWKVYAAVAFAVVCGIVFRLIFPFDIEYKADEIWTFTEVRKVIAGGPLPQFGMVTSFGPLNPGLSLWFFVGLDWLTNAATPPALAQAVQFLNCIAILALVTFVFISVRMERREVWLWGAALWALNPIAIAYERKIWPPSVFPVFTVAFIVAWWYRRNFWAALIWGMLGALMAQIHIGAGFFALAVAAWTFYANRNDASWTGWLIGSILGALPALPWLLTVFSAVGRSANLDVLWPAYFVRWVMQPFGLYVHLFDASEFARFLSSPIAGGVPTFAMLAVHAVLVALWLWMCARSIGTIRRQTWTARKLLLGEGPEWLLINASLWGYGGIMTLLTVISVGSARNYMIVVAPIMALWAAMATQQWVAAGNQSLFRKVMVLLCACQILISAGFLSFVHQTQIFAGEYGPTWASQQK